MFCGMHKEKGEEVKKGNSILLPLSGTCIANKGGRGCTEVAMLKFEVLETEIEQEKAQDCESFAL